MKNLGHASATAIARAIHDGSVSSEEAVSHHVAAIRAKNPRLNAVVRDRFAEALTEARAADAARGRG